LQGGEHGCDRGAHPHRARDDQLLLRRQGAGLPRGARAGVRRDPHRGGRARPGAPAAAGRDPAHRRVHLPVLPGSPVFRSHRSGREPGQGAAFPQVEGDAHAQPTDHRPARARDRARPGGRAVSRRHRPGGDPQVDRRARHVQRHQPVHVRQHFPARDGGERRCRPAPFHGRGPDSQLSHQRRKSMKLTRRNAIKAGAAIAASAALPAFAQAKPKIRFAAVFSEKDIRADMVRMFAKEVESDFEVEPFYNGSLLKQGTELVALQRDNLEMGNIAPQDISKQIPAWSILTSAYLFRDAEHLNKFWSGNLGAEFKKQAESEVKVKILGPTFFGTRQVGLKPNKKISTPADLAGIKLRMPPGDAWQLLGRSLGANPTPMAYAEVYTGLQTGAIDGQDNPLPNVQNMKFYEVMSQIVLTSHLVGYDLLTVNLKTWNGMGAAKQKSFQAAV